MSVEFYRGSPGKFDSRTLNRTTLSRWTGRTHVRSQMCVRYASGGVRTALHTEPLPTFGERGSAPKGGRHSMIFANPR